jgi:hypothetical protein
MRESSSMVYLGLFWSMKDTELEQVPIAGLLEEHLNVQPCATREPVRFHDPWLASTSLAHYLSLLGLTCGRACGA